MLIHIESKKWIKKIIEESKSREAFARIETSFWHAESYPVNLDTFPSVRNALWEMGIRHGFFYYDYSCWVAIIHIINRGFIVWVKDWIVGEDGLNDLMKKGV